MNLIDLGMQDTLIEALGWALIHFLWQGALLAAALAGVLEILRSRSAELRYGVACGALLLAAALPAATTVTLARSAGQSQTVQQSIGRGLDGKRDGGERRSTAGPESGTADQAGLWGRGNRLAPAVAIAIWLTGVILLLLRLGRIWVLTERLRSDAARAMDQRWREGLDGLRRRMGVKRAVQLLESSLVAVPTTMGWLRPVILLPASALTGLSQAQLEAILAHELAHIRRCDYMVNLLQSLLETLLFYHPAVWWISGRIRQERENCCDDLAVSLCGDPIVYARALLEMETLRAGSMQIVVAANGGVLMKRIQRLVGSETPSTSRFAGGLSVIIATVMIAALAVGAGVRPSKPDPQTAAQDEQKTERLEARYMIQRSGDQPPPPPPPPLGLSGRGKDAPPPPPLSPLEPTFDKALAEMSQLESLEALGSREPGVRAGAACRLGRLGSDEAIASLVALLGDETLIRPVKCWVDGNWGPAIYQLKHPSPGEQAALALASMGQASAAPLIAALSNANAAVRRNAAWAIGELRGGHSNDRTAAEAPLIALLHDPDVWVRRSAAFSLGEIRSADATEPLIAALDDREWLVRMMVVRALGEMKSRQALEPLRAMGKREQNNNVLHVISWALEEIE